MNISYDHYRIFYYVAKYQNLTQAAAAMLSNQPNVTRTIKNMERELGCALFTRSNRGVKLTPEGRRLYAHVRVAVEQIQAGEEELAALQSLEGGMVSISVTEVALRCFLLPVLREFHRRHPKIKLRVSNSSTFQAIEALRNRSADLALASTPTGDLRGLKARRVKTIHETAVCGAAFRQWAERPVSLTELAQLPIVSLGTETMTYAFYSQLFQRRGLGFAPHIEASTVDQILPMVKSDLGIGFVPRDFLTDGDQDAYELRLTEPIPARAVVLLKRAGEAVSLAAEALEAMAVQAGESLTRGAPAADQ